jgi:hypothetical protein
MDVRWANENTVWITSPQTGVFHVDLSKDGPPALEIPGGQKGGTKAEVFLPFRIAASDEYLAIGAPVWFLGWKQPGHKNLAGHQYFERIIDLDVWNNRVAVLGMQRSLEGKLSPDGAIAWSGSLDKGLQDIRTLIISKSGAGARSFDACAVLELGAIRFLDDGSVVVIPGSEPGVFQFGNDGKLLRTWQSDVIGLEGSCKISEETMFRLSADPEFRWDEMNRWVIVDDILPLPQGPALLVRKYLPGMKPSTTWLLKLLKNDGSVKTFELPISSPGGLAHLRGDVSGGRIVLLIAQYGRPELKPVPDVAPLLLTAEMKLQ